MSQRKTYRNGDEISLLCGCDGCSPSMINGVLCHEHGCPDAWRDYRVECFTCGYDFYPQERHQKTCPDCLADADDPAQFESDNLSLDWSRG